MRYYLLGMLGLLFCFTTRAQQTVVLEGVVVETDARGNISPIEGAIVFWKGSKAIRTTDSNGVFKLPFTASNNYLIVMATGYASDTILVSGSNKLRILMISKGELQETVISYERKSSEISFIDPWKTTIMNEKELFKAACCNLSESFETNPSVDVAFTDALSGAKQIQMLGLAGQYTQVSLEQMPGIRGVASNAGLAYVPGAWINSIQVSKGMASVVNGFESVSGQINAELHKSDVKEKAMFNAYVGAGGRYEVNAVVANKLNEKFSQSILLHTNTTIARMDRNADGYLDNPLGNQYNLMYRFKYDNKKGFLVQGAIQGLQDKRIGGELNFEPSSFKENDTSGLYGIQTKANRIYATGKMGYVFPHKRYKSIGMQFNYTGQQMNNTYGISAYSANQNSYYGNLIYQSIIGNTNHKFRTGFSYMQDAVNERISAFRITTGITNYDRIEQISGAFFEYTYTWLARFTMVAGLRADYHNLFGMYYTPRLHLRYAPTDNLVLRASTGKGWRTANIFAENSSLFVSSRSMDILSQTPQKLAYGFKAEEAWNSGINLTWDFKLNYRKGTLTLDYYYTFFNNRVIADRDYYFANVLFYQTQSTSSSFQVQADYTPLRRFDVRLAYRYYDVKTALLNGDLHDPMLAKHRGFLNLGYQTKSKWTFDLTANIIGSKRLPTSNYAEGTSLGWAAYSQPYWLFNGQVSKGLKKGLDVYLGCENILNFKQTNPIVDPTNPYGNYFDATMIWGPVFGRMVYGGIRWRL